MMSIIRLVPSRAFPHVATVSNGAMTMHKHTDTDEAVSKFLANGGKVRRFARSRRSMTGRQWRAALRGEPDPSCEAAPR
jgi:hypothetical protein